MVSSISGSSTSLISSLMQATRQKPSASELASEIFSKLDTSGQGYLEKTDFSSALSSSTGTSSSDAEAAFDAIDENGDGKVTQSELANTLQKLSDQMDASRMNQAMAAGGFGGPPPPPPSESSSDEGFTKDQLTSIAKEISSTDSERASFMSDIAANFDEADTNGDGKVSFTEAMAYKEAQESSSTSSTSSTASSSSTSTTSTDAQYEQKVLQQIVQLLQAYGLNNDSTSSATSASARLSVSA
jgi:Ca2+-binding EF-hand superfamily protein